MRFFKQVVSPTFIIDYMISNYGQEGQLSSGGEEFVMTSPFDSSDYRKKFSMNVYTGLWQDFKVHDKGDFIKFYALTNNLPYYLAKHRLLILNFGTLELEDPTENVVTEVQKTTELLDCELESISYDDLPGLDGYDNLKKMAMLYLLKRNLYKDHTSKFFLAREGRYKERIVIPYLHDGEIYYLQARSVPGYDRFPKYLNPPSTVGVRCSDILYPYDESAAYVVVTEGPVDAITLQNHGVNATCTQGSYVSYTQMQELCTFQGNFILSYDNDDAGKQGMLSFDKIRKRYRMPQFNVVYPPSQFKDWNEASCKGFDIKKHIEDNSEVFDAFYLMKANLRSL